MHFPLENTPTYLILGAGIAGLTAGLELLKSGAKVVILEKNPQVGGLAQTLSLNGFRFDLGGHRFHSNNPEVVRWLRELPGVDLQEVNRSSRIYIEGKFVDYPLRMPGALRIFPPLKAAGMGISYLQAAMTSTTGGNHSFEDWVVRRFGRRVFEAFFRPYTEKVWGISCDQLSADWAAARIGIPNLWQALTHSIFPPKEPPATAISRFFYPQRGFGAIPQSIASEITVRGGQILTNTPFLGLSPRAKGFEVLAQHPDGQSQYIHADHVISTAPLPALLGALPESTGSRELLAANRMRYRSLVCVFLIINRPRVSPDSWTYFPDQDLVFGRTHEPGNWSTQMVPEPGMTSLCAEIYTSAEEAAWQAPDEQLAAQVTADLQRIGWTKSEDIVQSMVVRIPYAYPVYDLDYSMKLMRIRTFLSQWERLHLVGRTGAFRYMNSDGVIEDVFRLMSDLVPQANRKVSPLSGEEGRWA